MIIRSASLWNGTTIVLTSLLSLNLAAAQESTQVVAALGPHELVLEDVDAMADQLPPEVRGGVFNDPQRIGRTLETLLVRRAVVSPILKERPGWLKLEALEAQERRKTLINMALEQRLLEEPAPNLEGQAGAYYDANPGEFEIPASVSVRQVLISTENRDSVAASTLARRVHQELTSGTLSMDEAVARYSEDASKGRNQGRYERVVPGQMVPAFERAAFALESEGEFSAPVESQYGFHIVQLEGRHPAGMQPRAEAVALMAARLNRDYLKNRKSLYLEKLGPDAEALLEQSAKELRIADNPMFEPRLRLALEEAVLRAYRQHYLAANLPADLTPLAREFYLTHRSEFVTPDEARAIQVRVPKTVGAVAAQADAEWLRELAGTTMGAQFMLAFPLPGTDIQQVRYVDGEPGAGRAANLTFALKRQGEVSEVVDVAEELFFVVLLSKHAGRQQPFAEIRRPLTARIRQRQEQRVWDAHVNEFHQLPLTANEELIASLRTRYLDGT